MAQVDGKHDTVCNNRGRIRLHGQSSNGELHDVSAVMKASRQRADNPYCRQHGVFRSERGDVPACAASPMISTWKVLFALNSGDHSHRGILLLKQGALFDVRFDIGVRASTQRTARDFLQAAVNE